MRKWLKSLLGAMLMIVIATGAVANDYTDKELSQKLSPGDSQIFGEMIQIYEGNAYKYEAIVLNTGNPEGQHYTFDRVPLPPIHEIVGLAEKECLPDPECVKYMDEIGYANVIFPVDPDGLFFIVRITKKDTF